MKILVAVAHPDDEVLGCGGTIAKFVSRGEVHSIIFSYGEGSNILENGEGIVTQRAEESRIAGEILGSKNMTFFGVPDNLMVEELQDDKIIDSFDHILTNLKPDLILTHSIDDPHPAHSSVARFVRNRVDKTKVKSDVYTFNIWSPFRFTNRDEPKMVVDISKTFKKKKRALNIFKSQRIWLHYPKTLSLLKDKLNGVKEGYSAVEVFYKWRS